VTEEVEIKGLLVSSRIRFTSFRTSSQDSVAQPSEPRPPASLTAATSSGVVSPAIGAWIMGSSMPITSSNLRSGQLFMFSGLLELVAQVKSHCDGCALPEVQRQADPFGPSCYVRN